MECGAAPSQARRGPHTIFGWLTGAMNAGGTLWYFLIVCLVCADILTRELLKLPLRGLTEGISYSLIGATFLQLANTLHVGRMTRADLFLSAYRQRNPAGAAAWDSVLHLLGAAVMGLVVYACWPLFMRSFLEHEIVGQPDEFNFPVWPLRLLAVIGSAATAVTFLLLALDALRGLGRIVPTTAGMLRPYRAAIVAVLLTGFSFWLIGLADFGNATLGALMVLLLPILIQLGVHISVVLAFLGFAGIWLISGRVDLALSTVGITATEFLANYFFAAIPLFVLMGLLVSVADLGRDIFRVARWALGWLRGGLGVATIVANAVFASITGSTVASATVFTKVATPEMMRHGYNARFSVGVVAGSSVLGMLIPPSILLIVYGIISEQSVGVLFIAAVVPGLILATAMCLMVGLFAHFYPQYVLAEAKPEIEEDHDIHAGRALLLVLPLLALIILVLVGIYRGFFTPTEGGAVGSFGALSIALYRRRLSWKSFWRVLMESGQVATAILFLVLAATIFSRMLSLSNLLQSMIGSIVALKIGLYGLMSGYVALLIVLGCFLESISIMLIVVPLALPVAVALGAHPVWFGIITVITVEIGLLTPPLGLSCYVVHSTIDDPRISLSDIFAGATPFAIIMLIVTILLMIFPALSLVGA